MKREYRKPYLAVESFQLDAAVASGCAQESKITLNQGLDNCVPDYGYLFGGACEGAGGVNVVSDNYYNTNYSTGNPAGINEAGSDACYHAIQYRAIYMNS